MIDRRVALLGAGASVFGLSSALAQGVGPVSITNTPAQPLLGITQFSILANYAAGALVTYQGTLYKATVAVTAGAFNSTQWAALPGLVNVLLAGAVGNGTVDDTSAIQAAATAIGNAGGGCLYFPAASYLISSPIVLHSNTIVLGCGAASVMVPSPSWADASSSTIMDLTGGNCFFQNYNYSASVITDQNIIVMNMSFNYGSYITASAHALKFRKVKGVKILHCYFYYGANATGLLACDDTLTFGCTSIGAQNAGFDHWEGCTNVKVSGNHVVLGTTTGATGIQVSGLGTNSQQLTSSGISVVGNTVVSGDASYAITGASGNGTSVTFSFAALPVPIQPGDSYVTTAGNTPSGYNGTFLVTSSTPTSVTVTNTTTGTLTVAGTIATVSGWVGITFNALGATSASNDGVITGNKLTNCSIVLDGPLRNCAVTANIIDGAAASFWLRNASGATANCVLSGNIFANPVVVAGNVAPIHVDGSGHVVSNNRLTGGTWNSGIWLPSTSSNNTVVGNVIDTVTNTSSGNSAAYQDQGTGNTIVDYNGQNPSLTWTPEAKFGTNSPTAQTGSGVYYRVGNVVRIQGVVTLTTVGTPSGALSISLPVAAASNNGNADVVTWVNNDAGATDGTPGVPCFGSPSSSAMQIYSSSGGGLGYTNFVNGATISFSGEYLIA